MSSANIATWGKVEKVTFIVTWGLARQDPCLSLGTPTADTLQTELSASGSPFIQGKGHPHCPSLF